MVLEQRQPARKKCFNRRIAPLQLRSFLLDIVVIIIIVLLGSRSFAAEQLADVPAWLQAHVGEGEGQIAQVVLRRARALYLHKMSEGAVKNPCYFAMDATRPSALGNGELARRFYVICETDRSFRAVPVGHGGGRDLRGIADFANGRRCAKNFSNAIDSKLTTGGAYVTGEEITSFKGYYRVSAGKDAALIRSFVQFDGEGDNANARQRAIGGHPAVLLRGTCLRKDPDSPHANHDGYVPFGKLVNYAGGRSNGCTSWSPLDAGQIIPMLKDNPTTLYIYPESDDIEAVAQAARAGRSLVRAGLYWNVSCLKEICFPKFWPKETLEPILVQYKRDHPAPPPRPTPICKRQ
jgi:L,D-transpeptidase catalytic domain